MLQAITTYLPNVKLLRCWNHTINATKIWLKKHNARHDEIPVYVTHIRELLNEESYATYEKSLKIFKDKWSKAFTEYYMKEIHPEVLSIN